MNVRDSMVLIKRVASSFDEKRRMEMYWEMLTASMKYRE